MCDPSRYLLNEGSNAPCKLRLLVSIDTMGFDPALIPASVDILCADDVLVGSDLPVVNGKPIRDGVKRVLQTPRLDQHQQQIVAPVNTRWLLDCNTHA